MNLQFAQGRVKNAAALAAAACASFGTLWLMTFLIDFTPIERGDSGFDRIVEFVRLREEVAPAPKSRPIEPPKQTPPKLTLETDVSVAAESTAISFAIDASLLSPRGVPVGLGAAQRGLIPISGFPPAYPRAAKMRGIEGAVELEFVIGENGAVSDIKVVGAQNGDFFIDAAIKALSRWRFSPKIVGGQAARQVARQSFTFRLEE
jgi:protein TonB